MQDNAIDSEDAVHSVLRICSWCERVLVDTEWRDASEALRLLDISLEADQPLITHGICPSCAERVVAQELDA